MEALIISGFATGVGSALYSFALQRLPTLGALAWKEISLIFNFEEELRKMHRTFLQVQDLVDHVESNPLRFSGGNAAWQLLFEDLQKLSYDADALLDQVWLHLIQPSDEFHENSLSAGSGKSKKLEKGLIILKSGKRLKLPHEVKEMKNKLDALAEEMKNLLHMEQVKTVIHKWKAVHRSWFGSDCLDNSSLLFDEKTILGRQEDKNSVIQLLGANNDDLSVIPLVAMGGMGKTALAQLVYNDEKFCNDSKFDHKIWISVSTDFDIRRITKSITEAVTGRACTLCDLDSLQRRLEKVISGKKFLLVLDDYWNENFSDWDLLSAPLRCGTQGSGSKVIVTTRSSMVSSIVRSGQEYSPQILPDDLCWELMKKRALLLRKEESRESFEKLGMEIAKKCKGLPLVAKTLGNVLHHKSTLDEWRCIAHSELWDLPQDENWVLHSLMLSYVHLPVPLRKCFAYCSLFPRDHVFEADKLVRFWMAEGFIQPQGERRLEDIGMDYFNNLCMRSFFHPAGGDSGEYKMHSLFHDLARVVSANTCSQVKYDEQNSYPLFGNACHLSLLHLTRQSLKLSSSIKNKRLRTFIVQCHQGSPNGEIDKNLFSKLKFLRTLSLCDIGLKELPEGICCLIYLRCLNLCGNNFEKLPKDICKLKALQTLTLEKCRELLDLPADMKKFSNLRHLMFEVGSKLRFMPPEFGKLTNLQTLSAFVVSKKRGHGIEELGKMDLLTGSLCIKNIERVSDESHARQANMKMKKYLSELKLWWEKDNTKSKKLEQFSVLNYLKPHENLQELEIHNYSGTKVPDWLGGPQYKFTKIRLQNLVHCNELPSLGELPCLKSLTIGHMDALERIKEGFYGKGNAGLFPSLVYLEVHDMKMLVEWKAPNVDTCMSSLTTLKVKNCSVLRSLPEGLPSSITPQISGCRNLQRN